MPTMSLDLGGAVELAEGTMVRQRPQPARRLPAPLRRPTAYNLNLLHTDLDRLATLLMMPTVVSSALASPCPYWHATPGSTAERITGCAQATGDGCVASSWRHDQAAHV
ncbi:hypothetical protein GCM10025762_12700 [Haloechinothrix salitolerans]